MSASPILTLGFGSFSGVGFLPTLGFNTSGSPPPPVTVTLSNIAGAGGNLGGQGLVFKRKRSKD